MQNNTRYVLIITTLILGSFGLGLGIFYNFEPKSINPIVFLPYISEEQLSLDTPFSSNLPIIIINTYGQSIPDEPKIIANIIIIHNESAERNFITDSPVDYGITDYNGTIGIEKRGYTSQRLYPKKNYGFETRNKNDPIEDIDVPLLGFPAEEDWILHGPYSDKTLMRNFLAYNLSNQIDCYASRTKFVELFINSSGGALEGQYKGIYLFVEKIKRDEYRVNITELNSTHTTYPDITGGYILKFDNLDPNDGYFYTNRGTRIIYVYPNAEDMEDRPDQRSWIQNYINDFETALYGPNFTDPVEGYAKYIDVNSFVDYLILIELLKNPGAYTVSAYFHKDRNGKLVMGPIWDYNIAMGNGDHNIKDWVFRNRGFWFRRLLEDDNFVNNVTNRWNELRAGIISIQNITSLINNTASLLNESQIRNFQKWSVLGRWIWPNTPPDYPKTYWGEIENLIDWFEDRINFIDNHISEIGDVRPITRIKLNLIYLFPRNYDITWFVILIISIIIAGIATLYISIKTNPKINSKNYNKRIFKEKNDH
ncbi:MAG: CotH kinase family protein [Candidatus Helarchaeota archaeon]|nr:CotH kinase family protein [Candidatus Helarchaeota archaeon]